VIAKLIQREYVYNVRSANRFIESDRSEVWDILEEIIKNSYVLLNRAPTLHRLGIQAFQPVLIEGKAIQIHPLVCTAFNADFDGDQMAVHVPLTEEAKKEAARIMLSSLNLLKPATGEPVVTPSQDIVLGTYYLTVMEEIKDKKVLAFSSPEEAVLAQQCGRIGLKTKLKVMMDDQLIETTCGRIIFNRILPASYGFINKLINKKELKNIIAKCLVQEGRERTVQLLDDVKNEAIKYITESGLSWGMSDTPIPPAKEKIMQASQAQVEEIQNQYEMGLLTDEERRVRVIEIWTKTKAQLTDACQKFLDPHSSTFAMIDSGARGSWGQVTQMMGMKGLVINPAGETIELPVKASFKEGFDVLEYFLSTHGARKGLSDTALRTANAGYLTRRLIDVSQDVVIVKEDCHTKEGLVITKKESEEMGEDLINRIIGRFLAGDIIDPKTKKVFLAKGELVTEEHRPALKKMDLEKVAIRSLLKCHTQRGACQKCYGYDLGHNRVVELGTAVGIIAAQSIGEPGTQLTMRTFHTGGVAGQDITQGLPRVEELFEARPIKKAGVLAEATGKIEEIIEEGKQKIVQIRTEKGELKEHPVPIGFGLMVKSGDLVNIGDRLSEGNLDLRQLYLLKGQDAVQKYIIKEIQYIYSSQGQKLNDKHVEIIIRQMFSRYLVDEAGDGEFVNGEMITKDQLAEANDKIKEAKGKIIKAENILLGITKASLSTDSFLSAASFQETARILIDAAITGKVDYLRGLKENVIIGKLIPVGTGFNDDILKAPLEQIEFDSQPIAQEEEVVTE